MLAFGQVIRADRERAGGELEEHAFPGRVEAEPHADPVRQHRVERDEWIGSQPTTCSTWTVLPTISSSTTPIIMPVTISIFLCGSLA